MVQLLNKHLRRIMQKAHLNEASPLGRALAIEKIDASLTPNMRALRLSADIADNLLAMGTSAADVVATASTVVDTYCTRHAHIDISSSLLTISQYRGDDREPLTIIRTISPKATNYRTIQKIQELAKNIKMQRISLDDAEKVLTSILANQKPYPRFISYISGGFLSAGIAILYTATPIMIILAFVMGTVLTYLIDRLSQAGIATFFTQAIAATVATLIAGVVTLAAISGEFPILEQVNPTILVLSGVVLLLAGMMIVGAFQDAIDSFYVTANARLLKVVMMTGGIVLGVAVGLYVTKQFGVSFMTTPELLNSTSELLQYVGAGIIAAAVALSSQSRFTGVVVAGGVGMFGWWIYQLLSENNFNAIAATGIAALCIGLSSTVISRLWRIPSMATISAGIIPLVPGLSLYNGLMNVVESSTESNASLDSGFLLLFNAVIIAVTIAAGASFGNTIGRPIRSQLIRIKNSVSRPFARQSAARSQEDNEAEAK